MISLFRRIKPILIELEKLPIESPIQIDSLKALFEKHSPFNKIDIYPVRIDGSKLSGFHISASSTKKAAVFHAACHERYEPVCEGCQRSRYSIAKELVHTFDKAHQKTPINNAADELMSQVIERDWRNHDGNAEVMAEVAAVELLARFPTRMVTKGSFHFAKCKSIEDFSYLAKQFGVPSDPLQRSFGDKYMETIQSVRKIVGI
jgi:hypothetical protein